MKGLHVPLFAVGFFLVGLGVGIAAEKNSFKKATSAPSVVLTENYDNGRRTTQGAVTGWTTGDGKTWRMAYKSDGIFIDCRK